MNKLKNKIETIQLILNMIKYTIPQIIEMWKKIYTEYIKQREFIKTKLENTAEGIKEVKELIN